MNKRCQVKMSASEVGFLGRLWIFSLVVLFVGKIWAQSTNEPPHPILTISGSSGGASSILSGYTEAQYLEFVPRQSPRNDSYGFAATVVPNDTTWSWNPASPNQITSMPSGTVFPNATYPVLTQSVGVLSGKTIQMPYYIRAGSSTAKTFPLMVIDFEKRAKLRSDLNKLAPAYINSGSSPVTRNDAYARRIAIALNEWANWFPDYVMTEKNSANFISVTHSYVLSADKQRASDHNGLAHEWADDELLAFDAIYDSVALTNLSLELGYDVRQHIGSNLFCNEGDFIVQRVPVDVAIQSNLSGPFTVLALVARVLNRPDYILWLDDYLDATVTKKIHRDGVLSEGISYSVGYLNENNSASKNVRDYFLTRPANTPDLVAISNRANSYVGTLTYGQSQWNAVRLPNGELPAFGDTTFGASGARNAGASALLPSYGHVSMGADSGSQSVQVNQNFPGNANHMRADMTAFVLWAFGNELLGNIRYYNGTPGRQFGEQLLSHNAVVIDRSNLGPYPSSGSYGNGNLTLYEPGTNGLAVTEIDGQRAYANKASRYQRIMMLNSADLTRPYVVDVVRVTGGTTHDYVLHGSIRFDQTWECSFPLVTNTQAYPMLEGSEVWSEPQDDGDSFPYYGFWRNVSSNQAPGNFQITYRDTSASNRDLRLWMTDDGTVKVYLGMTPNPERNNSTPPNFYKYWRPSAIIRKRVTSGTLQNLFVSVIEPLSNGTSTIQSVERLPVAGSNLEAVALKITFVDGRVDTYLVNLNNPKVAGATAGSATVSTADGQHVLTGRIGAYMDDGVGGPRTWTVNASDFQYPGRRFTTPGQYYSGRILGETRNLTGGMNDAFITDAALPLGTALRGRYLSLLFGTLVNGNKTGLNEMFQIDRVEQTNGLTYICFARDHMLEITNGATSVEQMAPQRTFNGTNQFEIALSAMTTNSGSVLPTISSILNRTFAEDGTSGAIAFTIGGGQTAASNLVMTANSSNTNLFPAANILLTGSGSNRFVTVIPATNQTGVAHITLNVSDGVNLASRSFQVTVLAVNDAPVLSVIGNRNLNAGMMLRLTNVATDVEAPPQILSFALLNGPVGVSLDTNSGVLSWRPMVAQAGTTNLMRVKVSDNGSPGLSATQSFEVVVHPIQVPGLYVVGLSNGFWSMDISGQMGPDYSIEASTNLLHWSTIKFFDSAVPPFRWSDTNNFFPARFYRVLIGP